MCVITLNILHINIDELMAEPPNCCYIINIMGAIFSQITQVYCYIKPVLEFITSTAG